jgi:tRNA pseudouridine38-40 synthase
MTTAAQGLLGRHDFRAFQASGSAAKSTERTLYRLDCARHGDRVEITVEADAFLYRMVRLLVCALRAVSRGELTAEALQARLHSGERRGLTATAPACGLCLLQVSYEAAGRTETGYY